jgi:hypothetical protein
MWGGGGDKAREGRLRSAVATSFAFLLFFSRLVGGTALSLYMMGEAVRGVSLWQRVSSFLCVCFSR